MKYVKLVAIPLLTVISTIALGVRKPITALPVNPVLLSQSDWQLNEGDSGQFVVRMPGKAETRSRTISILDSDTEWTILRELNDSEQYAVAYTDLTPETIELGADIFIDSIRNTLVEEFNWSALDDSSREISVDGFPGRELIGTQNDRVSILRLVLVDRRLYALMSSSNDLSKIANFFDSFEVQSWQSYVFEEEGFKVNLPLSPSKETESTELVGKEYTWEIIEGRNFREPDESYAVGYTDIASGDLQEGSEALIDRIGSGLLKKLPLRTVVENGRKVSLDGTPGKAYVAITETGQVIAVHFYLVDRRLYAVSARSEDISNIGQFISSFEIL